jgi:hypothetical protein
MNTDTESVPGASINQNGKSVVPAKKTGGQRQAEGCSCREKHEGPTAATTVIRCACRLDPLRKTCELRFKRSRRSTRAWISD